MRMIWSTSRSSPAPGGKQTSVKPVEPVADHRRVAVVGQRADGGPAGVQVGLGVLESSLTQIAVAQVQVKAGREPAGRRDAYRRQVSFPDVPVGSQGAF